MATRNNRTSPDVANIGRKSSLGTSIQSSSQNSPNSSKGESLQRLKNMAASRLARKPSIPATRTGTGGDLLSLRPTGSRPSSATGGRDASSTIPANRPALRGQATATGVSPGCTSSVQSRSRIPLSQTAAFPDAQNKQEATSRRVEPSNRTSGSVANTVAPRTSLTSSRSIARQVFTPSSRDAAEIVQQAPRASYSGDTRTSTSMLGSAAARSGALNAKVNSTANCPCSGQRTASNASPAASLASGNCNRLKLASRGMPAMSAMSFGDVAAPPEAAGPLMECASCGRCFNEVAYSKHVKICDKVFGQKRKQFNSTAARLAGTEAAQFVGKAAKASSSNRGAKPSTAGARAPARARTSYDARPIPKTQENSKPTWQLQSEAFRAAMQASRIITEAQARGEDIRNLTLPAGPAAADDRVPCPHCGRKFAPLTADRHIPKCKETVAKPSVLKAGGGKGAHMRNGKPPGRR